MPTSSSVATIDKKKVIKTVNQKRIEQNDVGKEQKCVETEKNLLKIGPALPTKDKRCPYVRSQSTLSSSTVSKLQDHAYYPIVTLHPNSDGTVQVSRTQNEKEKFPDRISLDRRGLTKVPIIQGEPKLRLLSLQHNLVNDLELLVNQKFPVLVFLDIYDNQLEEIKYLDCIENLRVLLMGKNRIKKIEGLEHLQKLEVLDLHGNMIIQVGGLSNLLELKVLNLAGNQIRSIGQKDLQGLVSLQELNLRRNRLKKILGFQDTPNLSKLFISNNDIQSVECISSIVKSQNIKEISVDNNPIYLTADCVSFLVSYLPNLMKLNSMQITEQVRKAAMAWRRNKEANNPAFMDLTSEASMTFKREEVISNARTNWELLRSQTKCLTNTVNAVDKTLKNLKPDSDFILTSLSSNKSNLKPTSNIASKSKSCPKLASKVPLLPNKKFMLLKTPSQETESSQNTSSSNTTNNVVVKLPPILVPIISKLEQKDCREEGIKVSSSLSSIGPNIDSSSSLFSGGDMVRSSSSLSSSKHSDLGSEVDDVKEFGSVEKNELQSPITSNTYLGINIEHGNNSSCGGSSSNNNEETSSNLSAITSNSILSVQSTSSNDKSSTKSTTSVRNIKSAVNGRPLPKSILPRASTAKIKKTNSPGLPKDREQGGDYLIEICGRHLNVFGQGALRFIDKPWNTMKANDVTTVKFNYVNFSSVTGFLNKVKLRFPNADHFVFKETNINYLGQLNALSEVQGLTALTISPEGNPICEKEWKSYAIYRLGHWGLKRINDLEISNEDTKNANDQYQSLSDLVLWSLPDVLLQPLLTRLRIDVHHGITDESAKKWIGTADTELRSVVSKEALQCKKGSISQDDMVMRQKDQQWPSIMHEFVQNTLLDYSQLDMYMKQKIQELNK
ncbi:leucine-rich repeat-containing protein 49 isoform X2 [Cylas formicarius]|uniref:leucine-rich repeat-containing protein 49 isoform X2 n=1 Tax=Cylas formicarius TaxID=197179 RepID=UPI0029584BF2|nr:leucine-rich repeat-containing protein 49 isoform X2 [Cylas formicarius]